MNGINVQLDKLRIKINAHSTNHGEQWASDMENAFEEILLWIEYYERHHPQNIAESLLQCCRIALFETVTYAAIGFERACIISMRGQIDSLLGFSYFCDHPVEWINVVDYGTGFMQRSDILQFHNKTIKNFGQKLGAIESAEGFDLGTIYGKLSSHIHGQSPFVMPIINEMSDLIADPNTFPELLDLQKKVSISISDYFAALHAASWPSLPETITKRIHALFADLDKQRAIFFA